MKNILKRIFALLLVAVLLAGCGSATAPAPGAIVINAQGIAAWAPVEGATGYEYTIVDASHTGMEPLHTTDTSIQLPEGAQRKHGRTAKKKIFFERGCVYWQFWPL